MTQPAEPHASPAWADRPHSIWNYPAGTARPPLRDHEIDKRRAPRRNDAIISLLLAALWAVRVFWESLYVEELHPTSSPNIFQTTYRFDPWNAALWACAVGIGAFVIPYGLRRLTLFTARRRRGESISRRMRLVLGIGFGVILGWMTYLSLVHPLWTDPTVVTVIGVATGLVSAVLAILLLWLYVDIPALDSNQ